MLEDAKMCFAQRLFLRHLQSRPEYGEYVQLFTWTHRTWMELCIQFETLRSV